MVLAQEKVDLFSAPFSILVALLEQIWHFDTHHVFYAFLYCMHVVMTVYALLRVVCKSVDMGVLCNEEKHDIPMATVARLFMLMLSRKLPMI